MVTMPAQNPVDPALRDACLPRSIRQTLQRLAGMIAFVGNQLGRGFLGWCRIQRGQLVHRGLERARQASGVTLVGGVQFNRK